MDEKREYRFTIIIEPCEEGGYFAVCPAFPGCHVEGETYEETLNEMRAAIDAFIEDYKEEGEPIPDDDFTITTLKVAVRVPSFRLAPQMKS
jgi:predicted RNase H-like HicB family nuclease